MIHDKKKALDFMREAGELLLTTIHDKSMRQTAELRRMLDQKARQRETIKRLRREVEVLTATNNRNVDAMVRWSNRVVELEATLAAERENAGDAEREVIARSQGDG